MTIETKAIERFAAAVQSASTNRSKELRLTLTDATAMVAEFTVLLAAVAKLENKASEASQVRSSVVDGGFWH